MNVFCRHCFLIFFFTRVTISSIVPDGYTKQPNLSCEGQFPDKDTEIGFTLQQCAQKCSVNPYCSSFDFPDNVQTGQCDVFYHHKIQKTVSNSKSCYTKNAQIVCNQSFPFAFSLTAFQYGCCKTQIARSNQGQTEFCGSTFYTVNGVAVDFYGSFDTNTDRFCECDTNSCEQNTQVSHTATTFKFAEAYPFLPQVKETFLEFYDALTFDSLQAEGCRGPQNRMEGGKWENETRGLCGCSSKSQSLFSDFYCDPTQSCAYNEKLSGFRGLLAMHYHAHTREALECIKFLNFGQAEHWCVYDNDCVGLLQTGKLLNIALFQRTRNLNRLQLM